MGKQKVVFFELIGLHKSQLGSKLSLTFLLGPSPFASTITLSCCYVHLPQHRLLLLRFISLGHLSNEVTQIQKVFLCSSSSWMEHVKVENVASSRIRFGN